LDPVTGVLTGPSAQIAIALADRRERTRLRIMLPKRGVRLRLVRGTYSFDGSSRPLGKILWQRASKSAPHAYRRRSNFVCGSWCAKRASRKRKPATLSR
ncbi:MAG: hypothetical protein EOS36_04200, partial [Mesorhizobium sp.]